jgi:hypothetical protein
MLAGTTGAIVASAQLVPRPFGANFAMPWVSSTNTRAYYLIDGAELDFIASDGTSGAVRRLAVKANQQAGIAVTPDGSRIAVAILTYTLPPPVSGPGMSSPPKYDGMDLYVEDVLDGGHHVEIFASSTAAEFPIGWIGGKLVVAVSTPLCCQSVPANPYAASAYHVVDPANGRRFVSLCGGTAGPEGPVEQAGVMCGRYGAGPTFWRWDGSQFPAPASVPDSGGFLAALAPDGSRVAIGGDRIRIVGGGPDDQLAVGGDVFGWLDSSHVVYYPPASPSLQIIDVGSHTSAEIAGAAVFLAAFPAAIG